MHDLKNVIRVEFVDDTHRDSGFGETGEGYTERTVFDRKEDGMWEVSYYSSSAGYCCPCCGEYADHRSGADDWKYTCSMDGELNRIPTEILTEEIRWLEKYGDENLYVLYHEGLPAGVQGGRTAVCR